MTRSQVRDAVELPDPRQLQHRADLESEVGAWNIHTSHTENSSMEIVCIISLFHRRNSNGESKKH